VEASPPPRRASRKAASAAVVEVETCVRIACQVLVVTPDELRAEERSERAVLAADVACWLAFRLGGFGYGRLPALLGLEPQDVADACRSVDALRAAKADVRDALDDLLTTARQESLAARAGLPQRDCPTHGKRPGDRPSTDAG
jgi:chromosomal replication initiation ATPase DnaA